VVDNPIIHKTPKNLRALDLTKYVGEYYKEHPGLKIDAIGISIAGIVDPETENINLSSIFAPGTDIGASIAKKFGREVFVLNDAVAGALAEKTFGVGKKMNNFVYVTISSGIGAGVTCNSEIVLGKNGFAGEVGYFSIDNFYKDQKFNHWESFASGNNLPKFYDKWSAMNNRKKKELGFAKDIFDLYDKGDPDALEFLEVLHMINASAITNIIVTYDPEAIIFGGAVMLNNGKILIEGLGKELKDYLPRPKMYLTTLGDSICLLGAAAYAIDSIKNTGSL